MRVVYVKQAQRVEQSYNSASDRTLQRHDASGKCMYDSKQGYETSVSPGCMSLTFHFVAHVHVIACAQTAVQSH